jgi:transcriptional regulator with XRE-family HTH domain
MKTAAYQATANRIGQRIKNAREQAGFSQERLAVQIRTSRRNVLRWEGGHNTPRAEHIMAIARETGKSVEFFLGDEDEEEAALAAELLDLLRRIVAGRESEEVHA